VKFIAVAGNMLDRIKWEAASGRLQRHP